MQSDGFEQLSEAFSNIVASVREDCAALIKLTGSDERDERQLLECARSSALQVSRLVDLVENHSSDALGELSETSAARVSELDSQCRAVRSEALLLLDCARNSFENPYDFLTTQALTQARDKLAKALNKAETAFAALRSAVEGVSHSLTGESAVGRVESAVSAVETAVTVLMASLEEQRGSDVVTTNMRNVVAALRDLKDAASVLDVSVASCMDAAKSLLECARLWVDEGDGPAASGIAGEAQSLALEVGKAVRNVVSQCKERHAAKEAEEAASKRAANSNAPAAVPVVSPHHRTAKDALAAFKTSSKSVELEWNLIPSDVQDAVLKRVEELIAQHTMRMIPLLGPSSTPSSSGSRGSSPPAAENLSASSSEVRTAPEDLSVSTGTVVPPGMLRGRSLTSRAPIQRNRGGTALQKNRGTPVDIALDDKAKQKLESFTGVTNLQQWQRLFSGDSNTVHVGGVIGDVRVYSGGSFSSSHEGSSASRAIDVEAISRACVSYVLSSNAAVISRNTTRSVVEQAATTLLDEVRNAVIALQNAVPSDSVYPEAIDMLVSAAGQTEALNLAATQADKFIVGDQSQRNVSLLLRKLHFLSDSVQATAIHLLSTLNCCRERSSSQRQDEKVTAFSLAIVLQTAAAAISLVQLMQEMHVIVITAREMSSAPAASPRTAAKQAGLAAAEGEIDFWTEKGVLGGGGSLMAFASEASSQAGTTPTSSPPTSLKSGIRRLFKRGDKGEEVSIPSSASSAALDSSQASLGSVPGSSASAAVASPPPLQSTGSSATIKKGRSSLFLGKKSSTDLNSSSASLSLTAKKSSSELPSPRRLSVPTAPDHAPSLDLQQHGETPSGEQTPTQGDSRQNSPRGRGSSSPAQQLVPQLTKVGSTALARDSGSATATSTTTAGQQQQQQALPKRGTLNQLVEAVTHWNSFDNAYMAAFIATYHSFTDSPTVLRKLMQRFDVPSSVKAEEADSIRIRVALVLKYWVETHADDLDDSLLLRIKDFAQGKLMEMQQSMVQVLLKEIEKQQSARANRKAVLETPPTNFSPIPGVFSPIDLILQLSSEEVARQMTLIDHSIFSAILPSELLGQSWNKPKTRHHSQNVFTLVTRLNRISYWIPSVVLAQDSNEHRAAAITKFIEIAMHLRQNNNFHTLMGVIAGLNMAAVSRSRLKQTWAHVPKDNLAFFGGLEALMSPTSSFKNYRAALRGAKLPGMPYLGCYLSDLTFIDEGNPDNIDGLINFDKRLDIFRILQEVEVFAKTPYKWPSVEPIHGLLLSLPGFSDKELYALSLSVEPRMTSTQHQ